MQEGTNVPLALILNCQSKIRNKDEIGKKKTEKKETNERNKEKGSQKIKIKIGTNDNQKQRKKVCRYKKKKEVV
jgi:hypothetical protein